MALTPSYLTQKFIVGNLQFKTITFYELTPQQTNVKN